jgi:hypothetical protein
VSKLSQTETPQILIVETAAASIATPASGDVAIFVDTDHILKLKNSSGALSQASAKTIRIPHTWTISGAIAVPSGDTDFINPMFVSLPSGQTANLAGCKYLINSGTSVTAKLQKNGTDATGFTGISVTTTAATTFPTAVTLADGDKLALVVTAVSGSPFNLAFTIFLDVTV